MGRTKVISEDLKVSSDIDMHGNKSVNANDAEQNKDYVTKQQLEILAGSKMPASDYGLIGLIDGTNKIFKTKCDDGFYSNSTRLLINGVRQFLGDDYTETDNFFIEITIAPEPGDKLILDYLTNN